MKNNHILQKKNQISDKSSSVLHFRKTLLMSGKRLLYPLLHSLCDVSFGLKNIRKNLASLRFVVCVLIISSDNTGHSSLMLYQKLMC